MNTTFANEILHEMFKNAPVAFFIKDVEDEFRYVYRNDKALWISEDDCLGKTDFELFPSDKAEELRQHDMQIVAAHEQDDEVVQTRTHRGETHHLQIAKSLYCDSTGHRYLFCMAEDVTELINEHNNTMTKRDMLVDILDKLNVGVAVKDADHDYRFVSVNQAFAKTVERKAEEIIGHNDDEMQFRYFPADNAHRQDEKVMSTGHPLESCIERTVAPDGTLHAYEVTKFPLHLPNHHSVLVSTFTDVTRLDNLLRGHKMINSIFQQAVEGKSFEKNFDALVAHFSEWIECDRLGIFRWIPMYQTYTSFHFWSRDGERPADNPTQDFYKHLAKYQSLLVDGQEVVLQDCDEEDVGFLAKVGMQSILMAPIFNEGNLWGVFTIACRKRRLFSHVAREYIKMVTDFIAMQLTNARQKQMLEDSQRLEAVAMVSSAVAHDFNNILQCISGFTELVLDELPQNSQHRADLMQVMQAVEQGTALTRQMLSMVRKQNNEPTKIDLAKTIRNTMSLLQLLGGKSISVELETSPLPCWAPLPVSQANQILTNAIVNARDAIVATGRTDGLIKIHLRREMSRYSGKTRTVLSITDNGCGIPRDIQQRIFEPFFSTKGNKGTGLGLATINTIIRQIGGDIQLKSEVGLGSTFTFNFPFMSLN